jgi:hypothetical protein
MLCSIWYGVSSSAHSESVKSDAHYPDDPCRPMGMLMAQAKEIVKGKIK